MPTDGASIDELGDRLSKSLFRGQIVGPHGSGKSTLVATLSHRAMQHDVPWSVVRLTSERRAVRNAHDAIRKVPRNVVLVIDGFEQLPMRMRQRIAFVRASHLIVTTHRAVRAWSRSLPVLATTKPTIAVARTIVRQLLDRSLTVEESQRCEATYHRHNGNIREMLFDLYDHYEQTCRNEAHTIAAAAKFS